MKTFIDFFLVVISSLIIFYACDSSGITNIDEVIIPSQNVSYSQYIQPIFNYKCTNSGCHDSETKAAGLDLTTWSGATADPLIVLPGFPESSKLIWSVEGGSGTSLMPPPYGTVTPLNDNQIQGLKTWISEGAKYN